jgi:hypothetical protein
VNIEKAVHLVRNTPEKDRKAVLDKLLTGHSSWQTAEGKALAHKRALFCSRLSKEKLWPER